MAAEEALPASSIRSKLTAYLVLSALISGLLVAIVGVTLVNQASDSTAISEMRRQAASLTNEAGFLRAQPGRALRFLQTGLGLSGATLYEINSSSSLTVLGGRPRVSLTLDDVDALARGREVVGKREGLIFVAEPISGNLALVLAREAGIAGTALPVGRRLAIAALVGVGVAAIVSVLVSNRITSSLRELSSAASDVALGRFDRRVNISSDDEIGVLARSFNKMAEDLGEADQNQRDFFLSISHELRTPLTAIQGYAEAIEDGTVGEAGQREAAGVVLQETKRLTRLVSDLLDLARIDAMRFAVDLQDVDVSDVLESIRRKFAVAANDSSVILEVDAEAGVVKADPDRLIQILSNLVENALRYTPSGRKISLNARSDGSETQIEVIDSGSGFDPEDLPRAFERQYLWGKYRGVREVGSGLGLAISKELSEAMGGRVDATIDEGGGARFTVSLPNS